ncbi:hypothetical protein GALMADRAFT_587555 [Galerina marginata CBS 339.88]|uniref:Uncharacterized protein n=1 Tax=Galerina marginata (strain CBS 339.88) TaxID=685588 RepID=A0A067T3K1_GALM3|nr:hypothetical protein GALMADRAFT_587555 [Galerina marginata CBS 339.88]
MLFFCSLPFPGGELTPLPTFLLVYFFLPSESFFFFLASFISSSFFSFHQSTNFSFGTSTWGGYLLFFNRIYLHHCFFSAAYCRV